MSEPIYNFNLLLEKTEKQEIYRATVRDDEKHPLCFLTFQYHSDTYAFSRLEDSVGRDVPEREKLIRNFGTGLFNAVFTGEILERFNETVRNNSRIRLKLYFKKDEPELLRIPWEFLFDGVNFLSAYEKVTLMRVIDGIQSQPKKPIEGPIRILSIVSSPLDLKDPHRLQIETEQMLLYEAIDRPAALNKITIDFDDEASLKNIQERLEDSEYHILHYTGHGAYSKGEDRGYLLLEDEHGNSKLVENERFAELLAGHPSLRFVVLSGCQTAKTQGLQSLRDLATPLLMRGIPAVAAMNYPVTDKSAIALARKIYTEISEGIPLDLALTRARKELLLTEGTERVDFATPVLYTEEPDCLITEKINSPAERLAERQFPIISPKKNVSITIWQLGRNFVGRRRELRRIKEDFFVRGIRAVVLHGIGGIGKTVTATKIAERLEKYFSFIYTIDCMKGLTIEEVLIQLNEFLKRNGISALDESVTSDESLNVKVNFLAQILCQIKLLLIFDNFETLLSEARKRQEIKDENLKMGLKALVSQCKEGTRFLFTSRYTFNLTDGRLTNEMDEINLNELSRIEALMVMNGFPELAKQSFQTKLAIYEKTGGQPYTINIFGNLARKKSIQDILTDISDVTKEMVEFTLLNTTYESLTKDTRTLLNRASIFKKSVLYSGLELVMKDNGEIPNVQEFVEELIHWGLLVKIDEDDEALYQIHTIVKDFIGTKTDAQERKKWLVKGAKYYENLIKSSKSVWDYLNARELYFEAGEYNKAGDIVADMMKYLYTWGFLDLVRKLNEVTVSTASGWAKSAAFHHLGMIHQYQGEYDKAVEKYGESLKIAEALGNKREIAGTLHQLAMIHQYQGEYEKAIEKYGESLKITEALGDKDMIARTLHQLGWIHQDQGEYEKAIEKYTESLKITEALGDKDMIARTLHHQGWIYQDQGEYEKAIEKYTESLKIKEALGDKGGIARTLHNLAVIHQYQGEYEKAIEKYTKSLKIREALGDKLGIAGTLHQLGMIHEARGEYEKAIEKYTESLKIKEALGDKRGIAETLHQLGNIHFQQGEYDKAIENYMESLKIAEALGDKGGIAKSLHQLGMIHEYQGEYNKAVDKYTESLKITEALDDKSGIAGTLHQLGNIHYQQGEYEKAIEKYTESLKIAEALGDKGMIAISLGQLGKVYEIQENFKGALKNYITAYSIFIQLKSPNQKIVSDWITELKEKIGESTFQKYLEEIMKELQG